MSKLKYLKELFEKFDVEKGIETCEKFYKELHEYQDAVCDSTKDDVNIADCVYGVKTYIKFILEKVKDETFYD